MANLRIKIEDRLINNLRDYCKCNHIKLNDYIVECIEKNLYTDKYGDLNAILNNKNNSDGTKIAYTSGKDEKIHSEEQIINDKEVSSMNSEKQSEQQAALKKVKRILKSK